MFIGADGYICCCFACNMCICNYCFGVCFFCVASVHIQYTWALICVHTRRIAAAQTTPPKNRSCYERNVCAIFNTHTRAKANARGRAISEIIIARPMLLLCVSEVIHGHTKMPNNVLHIQRQTGGPLSPGKCRAVNNAIYIDVDAAPRLK